MSVPALARARRSDAIEHSSTAAPAPSGHVTTSPAPVAAPLPAPTGDGAKRVVRTNGATAAKRKRHHLGFVLFAAVVVGLLVLGLVTLNAFVAQSSFRIDHLQARVDELSQHYLELEQQAAHLSAPDRIAAWARRHTMRTPGDMSVLRVSGQRGASPAGSDALAPDRLSLQPILEGGG